MKIKILGTVAPVISGLLIVLGVLIIYNLIIGNCLYLRSSDIKFFVFFLPVAIVVALIIQYFLTLPIWNIFKTGRKFLGMSLILFTAIMTIISGLIFGFVFWETTSGFMEFILIAITGIIAFAIYWTSNLMILKRLD